LKESNPNVGPLAGVPLPKGGEAELKAYAGKWIAINAEGEVRGSGETTEEASKAARRAGLEKPLFFFVVEGA